jgi:Diguanylate cyclase, GGDEF domain
MPKRTPGGRDASGHRDQVVVFVAAAIAAGVLAAATNSLNHWDLGAFVTLAIFTVASDVTGVQATRSVRISGSFLGIILAATTLGGGPAAALGIMAICFGWPRTREPLVSFWNNIANFAWFPLLAGLAFHAVTTGMHVGPRSLAFFLLVFVTFFLGLAINFTGSVGWQCYVDRSSFVQKISDLVIPVLPAEMSSALLTMGAVYIYIRAGTIGLILCALVFIIYQYLVGELLTSKRRGDALQRAATTDELTGLANRERFRDGVERRITEAHESGGKFFVLLMDLDRFKEVNDTLGHHY